MATFLSSVSESWLKTKSKKKKNNTLDVFLFLAIVDAVVEVIHMT